MRQSSDQGQGRSPVVRLFAAGAIWMCLTSVGLAEDCVLQRAAEFPIIDNMQMSPIVMLPIEDQPRRVLLDTGGSANLINGEIISNQKVRRAETIGYLGLYGLPIDSYYKVKSVTVGQVNFKDVEFYSVGNYMGYVDASLGGNYLRSFDVEIDPVKHVASFFLKNNCGDKVVYWPHDDISELPFYVSSRESQINITIMLNGKDVPAILDTGSEESYLNLTTARQLFGISENSPGVTRTTAKSKLKDERLETFRYQFETLALGNVTFKKPLIHLAHMADSGPKLILGMHELYGLHLFFAYGQHKLYFTTSRGDIAAVQAGAQAEVSPHPDPLERLNARSQFLFAGDSYESDNFDAAMVAADRALSLDPTIGAAHLLKASVDFKRGKTANALEEAKIATRDHPDDLGLYVSRMRLYADNGQFDLAFEDAETLRQQQPLNGHALNRSCWYGGLAGKTDLALSYCNAALAIEPKAAHILDSRAFVYFKAGQWDLALADFDAALKYERNSPHSLYGRGLVERAKGDASDAESDIAAAVRQNPKIAETFENF